MAKLHEYVATTTKRQSTPTIAKAFDRIVQTYNGDAHRWGNHITFTWIELIATR